MQVKQNYISNDNKSDCMHLVQYYNRFEVLLEERIDTIKEN
jgi:hypothetical protein